jgi:hypothetical protein
MPDLKVESVFDAFYGQAYAKLIEAEMGKQAQREQSYIERDAAKIAGELTDLFYQRINKSV